MLKLTCPKTGETLVEVADDGTQTITEAWQARADQVKKDQPNNEEELANENDPDRTDDGAASGDCRRSQRDEDARGPGAV